MSTTTFSGPVVSQGGFTGTILSGSTIQIRTATAAEIAAIGNAVNTSGKVAGTVVFDTTNSRPMFATGANANSTWVRADGTNPVTPS